MITVLYWFGVGIFTFLLWDAKPYGKKHPMKTFFWKFGLVLNWPVTLLLGVLQQVMLYVRKVTR